MAQMGHNQLSRMLTLEITQRVVPCYDLIDTKPKNVPNGVPRDRRVYGKYEA